MKKLLTTLCLAVLPGWALLVQERVTVIKAGRLIDVENMAVLPSERVQPIDKGKDYEGHCG